jgi:hypothetical protein
VFGDQDTEDALQEMRHAAREARARALTASTFDNSVLDGHEPDDGPWTFDRGDVLARIRAALEPALPEPSAEGYWTVVTGGGRAHQAVLQPERAEVDPDLSLLVWGSPAFDSLVEAAPPASTAGHDEATAQRGRLWTPEDWQSLMDAAGPDRSALPDGDLSLADIPPDPQPRNEATITSVILFAQTFNGYVEIGGFDDPAWEPIKALIDKWPRESWDQSSVRDLRATLFYWQRGHYHQGGWYTAEEEERDLAKIRALLQQMRKRLEPSMRDSPSRRAVE